MTDSYIALSYQQTYFCIVYLIWTNAVQFSDSGVSHISEVKLRLARLVLGLVTTLDGSTISVLSRLLMPTQPGHPFMGPCKEY